MTPRRNNCTFRVPGFYVEVEGTNLDRSEIVKRLDASFRRDIRSGEWRHGYDFGDSLPPKLIRKVNSIKYVSGKFQNIEDYYRGDVTIAVDCDLKETLSL